MNVYCKVVGWSAVNVCIVLVLVVCPSVITGEGSEQYCSVVTHDMLQE